MNLTLKVWRQQDTNSAGKFVTYQVQGVTPDMSFLEMMDLLNENLQAQGEAPVTFDHDCREGICGMCGFLINGVAHGGHRGTTVCQLSMRFFKDGDSLTLEPWRAKAFPVLRDLAVDRSAFDRIIQAGGFHRVPTGSLGVFDRVAAVEILQCMHFQSSLAALWSRVAPGGRLVGCVPNSLCPFAPGVRQRLPEWIPISPEEISTAAHGLPGCSEVIFKGLTYLEDQHFLPYVASAWGPSISGTPNRIVFTLLRA